ncbi:hypothetical protein A6K26_009160 [Gammaproteobacteria bacterium 2W06]|nr:hypothetical protein A6K26_009160 [Gammaproteobacteria bacterium 2W06]
MGPPQPAIFVRSHYCGLIGEYSRLEKMLLVASMWKFQSNKFYPSLFVDRVHTRKPVKISHWALVLTIATLIPLKSIAEDGGQAVFANSRGSVVLIEGVSESDKIIGSGVVLSPTLIATNRHVVEKLNRVKIRHQTMPPTASDKILLHPERDLALIEVSELPLQPIQFSRSLPAVGEKIYSVGAPMGLELSISDGIVSSIRHYNTGSVIQITTPISEGSSGGAVLNADGELIGLSSFFLDGGQNVNFALPESWVRDFINNPALSDDSVVSEKIIRNGKKEIYKKTPFLSKVTTESGRLVYRNQRFGYAVEVPKRFDGELKEAPNGDGFTVNDSDRGIELRVWGSHFVIRDSLAEVLKDQEESLSEDGWEVYHSNLIGGSFQLKSTRSGEIRRLSGLELPRGGYAILMLTCEEEQRECGYLGHGLRLGFRMIYNSVVSPR